MRDLHVFNNVTLDGYFTGRNGDLAWAHTRRTEDQEWDDFVAGNAGGNGTLLLGRITYEMMKAFWPTPQAKQQAPAVAEGMNRMEKVVVSRTLRDPDWTNTRVIQGDLPAEVRKLKEAPGEGITLLGSGSIVAQIAAAGLVDEYQIVVNPVVIGAGRTMFEGVEKPLGLKLAGTRSFRNGNVLLRFRPA
jgi:dihydrofolate reductase